MKKSVLIGLLFLGAVIAAIVYSSLGVARYRCEVCVTFRGMRACRKASAANRQEAERAAIVNACAQVASGVTDSNQCQSTPPDSVRWIGE